MDVELTWLVGEALEALEEPLGEHTVPIAVFVVEADVFLIESGLKLF